MHSTNDDDANLFRLKGYMLLLKWMQLRCVLANVVVDVDIMGSRANVWGTTAKKKRVALLTHEQTLNSST